MIFQSYNRFRDLRQCSAGAVAVMTAFVLPVLLAFASLGVEVGDWYRAQRGMQGAADAAAISAATEYVYQYNQGNFNSTSYQTVGQTYASLNGITIPASNVCLATHDGDCNTTQSTCATNSQRQCIVVTIAQSQGHMFLPVPEPTLHALAIVSITATTNIIPGSPGNGCLLALEKTGVGIGFNGGGSSGGFTGTNCTLASNSTPTSLQGFNSNNAHTTADAAILAGALSCQNNCTFTKGVSHSTSVDPYSTRTFGTAPSVPGTQSVSLSKSGTTVTATLPNPASYLFVGEQVAISGSTTQTVTVTSVISPTKFTYTASSLPTGTLTFKPCVSFTPGGSNNGGANSQHMQCYTGGSTNGTTTFKQYTIFSTSMSLGGTTVFDGTPTIPAVYAFAGGLTLGGTSTLGAGIYYVANGLTVGNGALSCGVTVHTATTPNTPSLPSACTLNNNAYGGITVALTSGQLVDNNGTLDWTALCTESPPSGTTLPIPGCDTQSNQILDATGTAIDTSGIVVFQSRSDTTATSVSGNSNTKFWIDGTLYFPGANWSSSGQVNFQATACTAIIAQEIDISGNGSMANGCLAGIGGSPSSSRTTLGSPQLSG
jgi:Flp pilus assembly protein TadG